MTTENLLADPLVAAGVALFILAAVATAVLTAVVRASALPDAPKLPYLDAISADRRRIAQAIRQDPAQFLTPQGVQAYTRMRQAIWAAAAGWLLAAAGVVF